MCQEVILGIGGVRMLRALGYEAIERFHMNEGHSSLLVMELLEAQVRRVLGQSPVFALKERCCADGRLNLTLVGANFSHYVNGVAMKHGEVSGKLLGYSIDAITNGVHAASWAAAEQQALFERRCLHARIRAPCHRLQASGSARATSPGSRRSRPTAAR